MILLKLQTITFCKTITSITDVCLLFSLQVKPTIAVRGLLNSEMDNIEARAIIKCLQKTDMTPEDTVALICYRTLLIHQIQPPLTFICSLNSDQTFLVASLETIHVAKECMGDPGATIFREGIAMYEHRFT